MSRYELFAGAVVVGALLTAFFWPRPIIEQITHHAVGISFPSELPQPPKNPPKPGTCGVGCHCNTASGKCVDAGNNSPDGFAKCLTKGAKCSPNIQPDLPFSLLANLRIGAQRLLSGQNVFTGEPVLGGARPLEAVP